MLQRNAIKKFLLEIFFPKFCFRCQREGSYLCQDCLATLDVLENVFCLCENPSRLPLAGKCRNCSALHLDGLYFAASYKNSLIRKLIHQFKYEPYTKELATSLALLIITHFNLIQKEFEKEEFIFVPVPLSRKKLKKRGFNQSEEIGKELAENLPARIGCAEGVAGGKIPLVADCLIKEKETPPQMELPKEERIKNIKGAFSVKNSEILKNKKILLVDDVYTTGATMEECSKILKRAGAKEVWGVVVARGE
ncbi:MAG: ComF family protein [Patescibacteria group bacterium]